MAGAGQAAATPGRTPPSSAPREGMRRPRAGFWPGAVEALQGFRVRPPQPRLRGHPGACRWDHPRLRPGPHEGRRHCGEAWGQSQCLSWPQVQGGVVLQTPGVRVPLPALPRSLGVTGAAAAGLPTGLALDMVRNAGLWQTEVLGDRAVQIVSALWQKPRQGGLCLVRALCPHSGLRGSLAGRRAVGESPPSLASPPGRAGRDHAETT